MAHSPGVKLNGSAARFSGDAQRVHVGIDIRFHDPDAATPAERTDKGDKRRGLAGAG